MSEYIKSHSNYVIKTKHQNLNDGYIYERDITTIGGLNQFAKGQVPIYKSSNFIITVNNDISNYTHEIDTKWEENDNNEFWTLSDDKKDDTVFQLSQDYYKLKDFAYYGSCTELIRTSIINIVKTFPGELYSPKIENKGLYAFYFDYSKSINNPTEKILGGEDKYIFDNPFNINIYSTNVDKNSNTLSYFANNGYKNYVIIHNDIREDITKWEVVYNNQGCSSPNTKIATVNINDIIIEVWIGNNQEIYYLTTEEFLEYHIRPIDKIINDYYLNLDKFEKILLNNNSNPKYTALFEVTTENDFGYITEIKAFTFPVTYGGFNIDVKGSSYLNYLQSLQDIATFYDEIYSDTLYRVLTHESIKNFDWSLDRYNGNEEYDEYVNSGEKIKKMLHIFGRELDEIKIQIDNINKINVINYNNDNTLINYFINDLVSLDGWDISDITPFKLLESYIDENNVKKIIDNTTYIDEITNSYTINDKKYNLIRQFAKDRNLIVKPFSSKYSLYPNGYIYKCDCENSTIKKEECNGEKYYYDTCAKILRQQIKDYLSEKEYTIDDAYNFFLKMLKLNSRNILSKKGTINGIESILSLFGLRSNRFVNSLSKLQLKRLLERYNNNILLTYNYTVDEFTSFTNGIEDKFNKVKGDNQINWYNTTKLISYNTIQETKYQGLPVKQYYKLDDDTITDNVNLVNQNNNSKILYPYFNKNITYDGNIYYQMNGGWLSKFPFQFDKSNNIIHNDDLLFTETLKQITTVNNLTDLTLIPISRLKERDIVYVKDLSKNYIIINGILYQIYTDNFNNKYFQVEVSNGYVKIGNVLFNDDLIVSDIYGTTLINNIPTTKYFIKDLSNGTFINIYIVDNQCIAMSQYQSINDYTIFENGKTNPLIENPSHYFQINNPIYRDEINDNGWHQLNTTDYEFLKLNTIKNYLNGNNPHTGYLNYDNGNLYLNYFKNIFKYSVDNDLFNKKCYSELYDEYNEQMKNINDVGFKNLHTLSYNNVYNLYSDKKIHYFGDIKNNDGTKIYYTINAPKNINEYNLCNDSLYSKIIETLDYKYNDVKYDDSIQLDSTNLVKGYPFNGVTDQIVNVKNISIFFNNTTNENYTDKSSLVKVKYFDDVIVNYLTQLLPSTIIPSIQYSKYRLFFYVEDTTGIFADFAKAYVNNEVLYINEDSVIVKEPKLIMYKDEE